MRSERTACVIINVRGYMPKSPKFAQDSYILVVSEGVESGLPIRQVNATVPDKRWKITYWFRNLDAKIPFRVDPGTGCIYTTRRLDREEKAVYVLSYIASAGIRDHFITAQITLNIHDTDMKGN